MLKVSCRSGAAASAARGSLDTQTRVFHVPRHLEAILERADMSSKRSIVSDALGGVERRWNTPSTGSGKFVLNISYVCALDTHNRSRTDTSSANMYSCPVRAVHQK